MGAWGAGAFENDDAMDFVAALAEHPGVAAAELRDRLDVGEGELDAGDASEALAAAAIVSTARPGSPVDRSDPSVDEYLQAIVPHVPEDLAPLAVAAIDRVLSGDSELLDLWEEAGSAEEFRAAVLPLREHLEAS